MDCFIHLPIATFQIFQISLSPRVTLVGGVTGVTARMSLFQPLRVTVERQPSLRCDQTYDSSTAQEPDQCFLVIIIPRATVSVYDNGRISQIDLYVVASWDLTPDSRMGTKTPLAR